MIYCEDSTPTILKPCARTILKYTSQHDIAPAPLEVCAVGVSSGISKPYESYFTFFFVRRTFSSRVSADSDLPTASTVT